MAVQKSKKSRSKRDMRRSHDGVWKPTLSTDSKSGEIHYRHHLTASGYYRGKQYIQKNNTHDAETDSTNDESSK